MRKIKILITISTEFVSYGGLTTVMMNYYRAMDRSDLQIDFASVNEIPQQLKNEIENNESKYYCLGNRKKHPLRYMNNLRKILKKEQYNIIHVNGNSATTIVELLPAMLCGINQRIVHIHNVRSNYPFLNKFLKPIFNKCYTVAVAPTKEAGEWIFNKEFIVLNNAIDLSKYKYNEITREKIRKQFNLEGKFVVGNIGKLNAAKNQSFLLKVFAEYKEKHSNSILVIGGGGDKEKELKMEAKQLGIIESVIFLGMVLNVEEVIQAFDCFVFTSIFEGLGMVLIESQAAGLKCISSSCVPIETKVSDNIKYLDLSLTPKEWAIEIDKIETLTMDRKNTSDIACQSIRNCGYDICVEANKLRRLYLK